MRFLVKYEFFWILPLTLLVAILSVFGLETLKKGKETLEVLVPISEISGFIQPDNPEVIYCASELLIENFQSFKTVQEKYRRIVYDPYYLTGAYVSPETDCRYASYAFLTKYSKEGYVIQSYIRKEE